jgi:hypothetical protein
MRNFELMCGVFIDFPWVFRASVDLVSDSTARQPQKLTMKFCESSEAMQENEKRRKIHRLFRFRFSSKQQSN